MLEQKLKKSIAEAFQTLFNYTLLPDDVALQPTQKGFSGNYTLVVFPFLKVTKLSPEELATKIGEWLGQKQDFIKDFNVVKGFLNIEITHACWAETLACLLKNEPLEAFSAKRQKVMVEFSSPNTNKPLHLGHLRNNFLGDSISRILTANGFDVLKVNLVNDRGIHICKSMLAYQKFGKGETPTHVGIKGDHLVGKYYVIFDQTYRQDVAQLVRSGMTSEEAKKEALLMKEVQEMLKKWENRDEKVVALWQRMNQWVYKGFEQTYAVMGIRFDRMYKESDTYLLGKDIVDEGLKKGVFYKKEDGSVWVDLTQEGMDKKLVLRADGTSVYMTQDMGTCDMKYKDFRFDQTIFVVGNEQNYHFKALFAIMKKLGRPYAKGLCHLSYGMVDLPSGKMKSREGMVVDADDLLQEMFHTAEKHTKALGKIEGMTDEEAKKLYRVLGLGALKYFLLKVDSKKRILFNPEESIDFQGNTGPFIQYTHARISAIVRRAQSLAINLDFDVANVGVLNKREIDLIFRLNKYISALKEAAVEYSPAIIARYVYELAKEYNGFYQEVPIFDVVHKDKLFFRVALSLMTGKIIRVAMDMLGIEVPERM